jgi:hypothetical protein
MKRINTLWLAFMYAVLLFRPGFAMENNQSLENSKQRNLSYVVSGDGRDDLQVASLSDGSDDGTLQFYQATGWKRKKPVYHDVQYHRKCPPMFGGDCASFWCCCPAMIIGLIHVLTKGLAINRRNNNDRLNDIV